MCLAIRRLIFEARGLVNPIYPHQKAFKRIGGGLMNLAGARFQHYKIWEDSWGLERVDENWNLKVFGFGGIENGWRSKVPGRQPPFGGPRRGGAPPRSISWKE